MIPIDSRKRTRPTPIGGALRSSMVRHRKDLVVFAGRGESAPNAFTTILGKPIAAVTAPTTRRTRAAVPRMSSSVRYRAQKRRIVAGAIQYSRSMAIPASKNASGERVLFNHLECMRADHLANQGR